MKSISRRILFGLAVITGMALFAGNTRQAAAAGLVIQRLALSFADGRSEITTTRNGKVRAHADILYGGAGLLEGYWEADGRVIGRISRHLAGNGTVTIPGPATPVPTFDPGTHQLRFVVTAPETAFSTATLVYFVEPEGAGGATAEIKPIETADGARLPFAPVRFTWEPVPNAVVFLISFAAEGKDKPVFSAYTKAPSYRLPGRIIRATFSPGKSYRWQVMGYDKENRVICRLAPRAFTLSRQKGRSVGKNGGH